MKRAAKNRGARGILQRNDAQAASELNLTPKERAMLPDPEWVTEDDADAIVGLRRMKTQRPIPLDEALKQLGLERPASARRH
jgi:hypothetical protein